MIRSILIVIFFIPLFCMAGHRDSTASKNFLSLHVDYPVPLSGVTFQRVYVGAFTIDAGFERLFYRKFSVGVFMDYSVFQINTKVLAVKTTMNIASPSLNIGYQALLFKKIFIHPSIHGGYAFISFNGKDANGNPKPKFREQGVFVQPSLLISYMLNNKLSIGVNAYYKVIFQHFGNNSAFEENTTRMTGFGVGVTYKL